MMYTIIVFILTLSEVSAIAISYALHSQPVFTNVVLYGSPFYLVMNLLNHNSSLLEKNPIYMAFAAFHILKYFSFFRSQLTEDSNILRTIAIIFEGAYMGLCGYYLI